MRHAPAFQQLVIAWLLLLALPLTAFGQESSASPGGSTTGPGGVRRLITAQVDETQLTRVVGSTHPLARAEFDQGAAPGSLPASRMLLVLKRTQEQEAALEQLLQQQQDKSSANYHKWLTPQQFGQQFGLADEDLQALRSWLESRGFQVTRVANGRTAMEFSGVASQVKEAFHTEIHKYVVNGEEHWANASDTQIPSALAPAVAGIASLHNFVKKPSYVLGSPMTRASDGRIKPVSQASPQFTIPGACGVNPDNCFGVGPFDFATIYNVLPLWNATPPIVGTSQTIAIVGRSDITLSDVSDFRSYFALPAGTLPVITVDGTDPGVVPGDETEAVLDVEWAGAVAPSAAIDLVVSASTFTSDGVDLSAIYIVDNNVAPIMNVSFGLCEFFLGNAENQFLNNLWQQASGQGITVFVAAGDSGAAGCNSQDAFPPSPATFGLAVNGLASTPFNVAVGGTDFNDAFNPTNFWNLTNAPGTHESAKGYIPETTWNVMCTNPVFAMLGFPSNPEATCNDPNLNFFFISTVGGSGGKSNCVTASGQTEQSCSAGYPKPPWQVGSGVPADGVRDLPDVSLFAAINGPSGSFLIICEADQLPPGITSCDSADPNTEFLAIGGTSGSAPSFAGIMALVEQETGLRQGNANFVLYKLAAKPGASCTSAANPSSSCIFYDIPAGGTIATPCATGSLNCNTAVPSDIYGILSGFSTTAGYDLATGLGSVNVNNLVKQWSSVTFTSSSTALTLNGGTNSINVTHGTSVNVNVVVTPSSPEPTGTVALVANQGSNSFGFDAMTLSGGSASGSTNLLPGGSNYTVQAHYSGDGAYGGGSSNSVSVTVNPEPSKTILSIVTTDQNGNITNNNATTFPYGSPYFLRTDVTNSSGTLCFNTTSKTLIYACPTGSVAVTDNGNPLTPGALGLNSEGDADFFTIQLSGGSHTLGGNYSGDNSYNASPGNDAVTVTPAASTTVFTSFPNTALIGVPFNLVIGVATNTLSSGAVPGGSYTLFEDGAPIPATFTTSGFPGSSGLGAVLNGFTSTSVSLPSGFHTFSVSYSGDQNYAPSATSQVPIDLLIPTQAALMSSNPAIQEGQSVTFTATVTPNLNGNSPPSGFFLFTSNGSVIGNPMVTNGQAQVTTSSLTGGADFVVAQYGGDSNYASSNVSLVENVTPISTTTALSASSSTITQGQPVTLTAQITPAAVGVAPASGSVQFSANGTVLGNGNVSNNQAQLQVSLSQTGSVQLQASYSGDSNYTGSSGTFTVMVTPAPNFSVSASPSTITIASPGQSGSTMITVTSMNGFAGSVNFTCTGLPSESTCSAPAVNGSGSTTLTVTTTKASGSTPRGRPGDSGRWTPVGWLLLVLCTSTLFLVRRRTGHRWVTAAALVAAASLAMLNACGGGGGPSNPGTPAGTTNAMVTATGTMNGTQLSHAIPVTITVQ